MKPIKIIIADLQPAFANQLCLLLESTSYVEVTAITSTEKELFQILDLKEHQVMILDTRLPEKDCTDFARFIKKRYPNLQILLLAEVFRTSLLMEAFQAGISGYLLRTSCTQEMQEAILTLSKGENYIDDYFANELTRQYRTFFSKVSNARIHLDASLLSERETQVLTLIAQEFSNSEIAEKLFISPSTVETHRKHLIKKLGVRNSLGLVKHAIRNGLIDLN